MTVRPEDALVEASLAREAIVLGRRPGVQEPLSAVRADGSRVRVAPCSGKHRVWLLAGAMLPWCSRCVIDEEVE